MPSNMCTASWKDFENGHIKSGSFLEHGSSFGWMPFLISPTTHIQGGPEKTAQTLMRYNFSTACHRVTQLPVKCSETNW